MFALSCRDNERGEDRWRENIPSSLGEKPEKRKDRKDKGNHKRMLLKIDEDTDGHIEIY